MKLRHLALEALALAAIVSCSPKSNITGEITDYPNGKIVVASLGVGTFSRVDTVKTGADASFSYSLNVNEGQPTFVYIYKGDTKIASLLVDKGEKLRVTADTLGNYSVEGSEGSALLAQVEKDYDTFCKSMMAAGDGKERGKIYVDYYRSRVKYLIEHPYSLTVIPVLYQSLNNLTVFRQYTDALHFRSACDSLKTVYPESEYVKALEKETEKREQLLGLSTTIQNADRVGYPEINLPDINGQKVSLSSLDAKAVLVHFWSAEDVAQKMMNLEVLQSIYEQYRSRGFEIYSVCVSPDKVKWASVVKAQNLPWINVNDGLGAASPVIPLYNVNVVPVAYLIAGGEIVQEPVENGAGLRKLLDKVL